MTTLRENNIFILGAGFSAPAKLPLAKNLWNLILNESKKKLIKNNIEYSFYENFLEGDIADFIDYHNSSRKDNQSILAEENIELEEFISYLDIEDFLHLLGPKHWSSAGNQSQILIRNYIARIIYQAQLKITDSKKKLYDKFVNFLKPNDLIITFNYDTIVEDALARNKIPYRLYWNKLKKIDEHGNGIIDSDNKEIILHKMHGSIDWVSDKYFISGSNLCIWNRNKIIFNPKMILSEPYFDTNELQYIYRIKNLGDYFQLNEPVLESPFIISPSINKIVYLNPLKELWNGFIGNGQGSKRLVFIGFSLPPHDDYIRQPLYWVAKNFESTAKYENNRISVIDCQNDLNKRLKFKEKYSFLDDEFTDYYFDGFSEEVLNDIF